MDTRNSQDAFYLYVEDDASNRKVMSLLMEKVLGTDNYIVFEDSVDFMQRVGKLERIPDLIMLDIHMQPVDGFELLRQLRADPVYASIKVIALTASVMDEEVENLRSHGFDGAIGKPLNLHKFPAQIELILKGERVWAVS